MDEKRSRAVGRYLWSTQASHPSINEGAVIDEFGHAEAETLIPYLKGLVAEMNKISIDWSENSLQSGADLYAEFIRRQHPELSEEAVIQLRNAFSYWWK
jgi:hypothetical protein